MSFFRKIGNRNPGVKKIKTKDYARDQYW